MYQYGLFLLSVMTISTYMCVGVTSTAPVTHDGSAAIATIIGGAVGGVSAVVLALAILFVVVMLVILTGIQRRTKAYDVQGNYMYLQLTCMIYLCLVSVPCSDMCSQ